VLKLLATAVAVLSLSTAGAALAQEPAMTGQTMKGPALVDAKGMTLYTFDRDSAGKSACNGNCAVNWPPLMASAGAKAMGSWTVVKRDDGKMQWAYKGKPLYGWVKDTKAGETTGDGVNGVWHIAKP
jgi:predicted lipoprotein with Yx(FWY)xxD motif